MPPLANWKGYLKLSLVTCPVALSSATSDKEKVSFQLLNRATDTGSNSNMWIRKQARSSTARTWSKAMKSANLDPWQGINTTKQWVPTKSSRAPRRSV
jgi:hypothetical protein